MSRDIFKVVRVAPSHALFQDVSPGDKPIPKWLKSKDEEHPKDRAAYVAPQNRDRSSEASRLGPPTARRGLAEGQVPSAALDPLYEAKVQSESLAAEMRESWRVPAPADQAPGQDVFAELGDAIIALELERRELLKDSESAVLTLVRVVTERVLARELKDDSELARRLVREGLSALEESTHTSILLGYGFESQAQALSERLTREGVHAEVAIDDTLEPYACLLRSSLGSVDESLTTRLDAILSSLSGAADS